MSNGKILSNLLAEINLINKTGEKSELELLSIISELLNLYRNNKERQSIILEFLNNFKSSLQKMTTNEEQKSNNTTQENIKNKISDDKIISEILTEIELTTKEEKGLEILVFIYDILTIFRNKPTVQLIIIDSLKELNNTLQKISVNSKITNEKINHSK